MVRYRDGGRAGDLHGGHAVAVDRPTRTACGLAAGSLVVIDRDWERGTYRTKCVDCILALSAAVPYRVSASEQQSHWLRRRSLPPKYAMGIP